MEILKLYYMRFQFAFVQGLVLQLCKVSSHIHLRSHFSKKRVANIFPALKCLPRMTKCKSKCKRCHIIFPQNTTGGQRNKTSVRSDQNQMQRVQDKICPKAQHCDTHVYTTKPPNYFKGISPYMTKCRSRCKQCNIRLVLKHNLGTHI